MHSFTAAWGVALVLPVQEKRRSGESDVQARLDVQIGRASCRERV